MLEKVFTMSQSNSVAGLEPQSLWAAFSALNQVPRPSKQEERVTEFARKFGEGLGLETHTDDVGNVLIRKPASPGMESRPAVVMQAHLDMVHQKNSGTNFDFATEGIRMLVEGDWVRADGTTLGADNGIGVAAIMAVLQSSDLKHPPIEALFTIDEETGMTGAKQLSGDWLTGKILLNLDTEEDTDLTIGCAGGVDVSTTASYEEEAAAAGSSGMKISISGLTGGHSGMDIHLGRGNANKLMNRLLYELANRCHARISSVDGGGLRNAIPRESVAVVSLPGQEVAAAGKLLEDIAAGIGHEYSATDPGMKIRFEAAANPAKVMKKAAQQNFLSGIDGVTSGIWRMSPSIPDLVQTSNNLARVVAGEGKIVVQCLTRSSVNSERDELARILMSVLAVLGGKLETAGEYPGWQPEPDSGIVKLMSGLYQKMFGDAPRVAACHAGLECGIIGSHYPGMEMISFGPNIRGAHSPDEKVQISSVGKFWKYLTATLAGI